MENTKQTQYHAAAYVRLSKEDLNSVSGLKAESNSISNQKQLILDYLKDKTDINLVSIREDDGYTGTDYDRPDFQRMMDDIRAGVVNCVIVKDYCAIIGLESVHTNESKIMANRINPANTISSLS